MRHIHIPFTAAILVAMVAGCEPSATEAQNEAREAQARADEAMVEARREAEAKVAKVQERADEQLKKADDTFVAARDNIRDKTQRRLDELSKKADELESRISAAGKRSNEDLRGAMVDVDARRETIRRDIESLENVTAEGLTVLDDTLRTRLEALDKAIRDVSDRI